MKGTRSLKELGRAGVADASELAPALRVKLDEVRTALREAGRNDIHAKYKLGELVALAMQNPNRYGRRAVEHIGDELGYEDTTLYGFARVATCWSPEVFATLLERRGVTGLGLGFSHLRRLATVESDAERNRLIAETLAEGLSVQGLGARITELEAAIPRRIAPLRDRFWERVTRTSETCLRAVGALEEDFLPRLEHPPAEDDKPLIADALARNRVIAGRLGVLIRHLEEALELAPGPTTARVEHRPVVPEVAVGKPHEM